MCELAVADSPFIMVDSWEVSSTQLLLPTASSIAVSCLCPALLPAHESGANMLGEVA